MANCRLDRSAKMALASQSFVLWVRVEQKGCLRKQSQAGGLSTEALRLAVMKRLESGQWNLGSREHALENRVAVE